MSLFGKILSIDDVLSRVPQLENQLEKLENEDSFSRGNSHLRGSFVKRCHELGKQVDDQKRRVGNMKVREGSEEQKIAALLKLNDFQSRISSIAPERDRGSGDYSSSGHTRETSSVQDETEVEVHRTFTTRRRPSMYDGDTSDEDSEEEEEEQKTTAEIHEQALPPLQVVSRSKAHTRQNDHPPVAATRSRAAPEVVERVPRPGESLIQPRHQIISPPPAAPPAAPLQDSSTNTVEGNQFVVLADFAGEESSDLSIRRGEVLTVVQTRADGWWTARNSQNQQGLVPKTFLRHNPPTELAAEQPPAPKPRTHVGTSAPGMGTHAPTDQTHTDLKIEQPVDNSPVRCLGEALRRDPHLSYACHLTPRLSHSNLAFHDLYWNYQDDKLRKRRVRVSRLVRIVRLEGMPRTETECGLVRGVLYDQSRKTGRQLVSNVHSMRAQIKNGTWSFITRTDTTNSGVELGDFILRSNYKMADVVLLLEVSTVHKIDGKTEEKSLGIVKIPIVSANGECALLNKTYTEFLLEENIFDRSNVSSGKKTSHRLIMKVLEIPHDIVSFVDSMPDVLLFNPMYVRIAYFYRRRAGTVLIRDRSNPLSAEMVSDPLLAVFPFVADQPDLMDLLRLLWNARYKTVKNKSEAAQAQSFFQIFMNTAYCIHRTAIIPDYCIHDRSTLAERQEVFNKCVDMLREYKTAARFLLTTPSKPINIYDYSLDLMGTHAID